MIFLLSLTNIILVQICCLSIRHEHFEHNLQASLIHSLQSVIRHHQWKGHDEQIPDKVFTDLKDYVSNDNDITNRIHAQVPLTKTQSDKVKQYFLENAEFKQFTIRNLVGNSQDPHCLDGLSERGSDKLFQIMLDQLDFSTIFMPEKRDQQFSKQQIYEIILELKTDKQLRQALQKCFRKNKN